jgi:arylsulfatase A-like enzyme
VGEGAPSPRREFFYLNNGALEAVRRDHWKLRVVRANSKTPAVPQLFDLAGDPYERFDVAARQPQVVGELLGRMRAFAKETGATHVLEDLP